MFTLLHTNDFHGRLSSSQAETLHQMRHDLGAKGLLLDAGDAVHSGNITFSPGGERILSTMNEIGYDALTAGNREFHFSRVGFHCKLARAAFPILCANVRPSRQTITPMNAADEAACTADVEPIPDRADPPTVPYIVHDFPLPRTDRPAGNDLGSFRVVIFGLTVPMITERMLSRKVSAYIFDDPLQTAALLAPQLKRRYAPDLMVALTHIGIQQDRKLAATIPGIDLIIGGHTHVVLDQGERIGETLIVQAGSHGRFVGRVIIEPGSHSQSKPILSASLESLAPRSLTHNSIPAQELPDRDNRLERLERSEPLRSADTTGRSDSPGGASRS